MTPHETGGQDVPDEYPYWQQVPTRWKDNDVYGHLNNVVHYSFMDTVVNTWLIEHGGLDIHEGETIGLCVGSQCEYHAPAAFPDVLRIGMRVGTLGRTSVRYELGMYREDGTLLAQGRFTHVFVDRRTRKPAEITGTLRDALHALLAD
jgi:acyl-CoA thioester hydrolase